MRAKNAVLLGTIRLLLAAIKQREVDEQTILSDDQIIAILDKMVRQRQDSIEQFLKGSRQDLADIEIAEMAILKKYLPQPLTDIEVKNIISDAITTIGATSIKDMAKVMTHIKAKIQGKADMSKVSSTIKEILSKD